MRGAILTAGLIVCAMGVYGALLFWPSLAPTKTAVGTWLIESVQFPGASPEARVLSRLVTVRVRGKPLVIGSHWIRTGGSKHRIVVQGVEGRRTTLLVLKRNDVLEKEVLTVSASGRQATLAHDGVQIRVHRKPSGFWAAW